MSSNDMTPERVAEIREHSVRGWRYPSQAVVLLCDALEEARAEIGRLQDALMWCGGSRDFSPEGVAYEGWRTVVLPLLPKPEAKE